MNASGRLLPGKATVKARNEVEAKAAERKEDGSAAKVTIKEGEIFSREDFERPYCTQVALPSSL